MNNQSQPSIVKRLIKQSGWTGRVNNYMSKTSKLLWDAIDEIRATRAKVDELTGQLRDARRLLKKLSQASTTTAQKPTASQSGEIRRALGILGLAREARKP